MWKIFLFSFLIFKANCLSPGATKNSHLKMLHGKRIFIENAPYYVQLFHVKWNTHFCGGVILSEEWVLTAAHCIKYREKNGISIKNQGDVRIITGTSQRYTLDSGLPYNEPVEWVIHPNFDIKTEMHDIALIKLKNPIKFNAQQKPVKIRSATLMNSYVIVSGMGYINDLKWVDQSLESIMIPTQNPQACQVYFTDRLITNTMFCAGTENEHTCVGDSGGPAVDTDGQLVGIVSWGVNNCERRAPSIFTNVMLYRDWIEQYVHPKKVDSTNTYNIKFDSNPADKETQVDMNSSSDEDDLSFNFHIDFNLIFN